MSETLRPQTFSLRRDEDATGVSGTGHVADGVMWPDGSASLRWRGKDPSVVHWDRFESVRKVHGHNGATRLVWDLHAATSPDLAAVHALAYDRDTLVNVIIYHGRTSIKGCHCGWAELGKSHAEHVADVYEASVTARADRRTT